MNQNIQPKQIELIVTRDDMIDTEYLRAQRINHVSHALVDGLLKLTEATGRGLGKLVTPIALDWHDARTGDHLRDEWFEKKREAASKEIRSLIEL